MGQSSEELDQLLARKLIAKFIEMSIIFTKLFHNLFITLQIALVLMVLTHRYVTSHFGNLRSSKLSNTMIKGILLLWVALKSQDIF